jgi:hypothetical protein
MLYLVRRKFPDRLMDEDELDAVAALWRAWYGMKHKSIWGRREAYQFLEIRLWGFVRSRSEKLVGFLEQRLSEYGLSEAHVELLDPDTIKVTSPSVPTSELLPRGLWLDLFTGEEFSGLPIMVRLTISEHQDISENGVGHNAKLVLVGELRENKLQLKAVWPNILRKDAIEQLYHRAVWPNEIAFLRALDDFRATGRVDLGPAAAELFATHQQVQFGYWFLRLFFDLPGQSKLSAFLGRIGFFTALLIAAGSLMYWAQAIPPLQAQAAALAVIAIAGLGYNVWRKLRHIVTYHSAMQKALRRAYSGTISLPEVDLQKEGVAVDAAIRKYSSDLEAAGAIHLIDVRSDPPTTSLNYFRIFQLPADRSYLHLGIILATENFHFFPGHAFFVINTYFEDGSRLVSISKGSGYKKKRKANVIVRCFPDAKDPGELIGRHRQVLKRLLEEGRRLAPLLTARGVIDTQIRELKESSELAKAEGYYSWGAAVRQSFGLVRREYLQDS